MATSMAASISAAIRAVETRDAWGMSAPNASTITDTVGYSLSESGSDLGDHVYHESYSIANAAEQVVDLAGTLTDKWGNTITFTKVNLIMISSDVALTIGGGTGGAGAADAFAAAATTLFAADDDMVNIVAGGWFIIAAPGAAGYVPVAGTADVLCISNDSGGTAEVDVIIMGLATEAP